MNFKLLAIRPLNNTSSELLKGLQENFIYRFYNEYKYLDKNGNEIIENNEYWDIESIKYIPTVPSNLYGKNISVSAIVGENGSGKSSLLEIFYYFLFSYSRTEVLLGSDEDLVKIPKEFHFEFYYLLNEEIYCIEWLNTDFVKKVTYTFNKQKQNFERNSDIESFDKDNSYQVPIYNIVTNYSIYGLNSNSDHDKWLDKLFIKNDGYQTPIVLNPYREYGLINVNREFDLANSRLLKIFLSTSLDSKDFNTSHLINDISVSKLLFKLDIDKHITVYFNNEEQALENVIEQFVSINEYDINDFYNSLNKKFSNVVKFRNLNFSYYRLSLLDKSTLVDNCIDLSNLYVFKKIIKIVHNYKNYKKYVNVFRTVNIGNLNNNPNLRINFISKYRKMFIEDENLNVIELIADAKKRFDFKIEDLKDIENYLLKYYYKFYEKKVIDKVYSKYKENRILEGSLHETINYFLDTINDLLNSKKFKHLMIDMLLEKLSEDYSHVTLKLRQILNMQMTNFFQNLIVNDGKDLSTKDDGNIVYYSVKKEYLSKNKNLKIEEIPSAFLEPIFMFSKKDINEPFELKYLSSGEQQLLHSTISISYHIDNLLSIIENEERKLESSEQTNLITYKYINIILDEIELYYHPEYQRKYIHNLTILLSQLKYEKLYFNVIFSTHSPFILSDIPSQNILKLKEGKPKSTDGINSFAANIYDLLKDEFFLNNGAIGAYASSKIASILKKEIVEQEDIDIINLIGDPFLKGVIKKQIENKTSIDVLEDEIRRLQIELQQKKSRNATN